MRNEGLNGYEDIIDLPHHVSARHPQMPLPNRAAQFAPFAALSGHDEAIKETARLTDSWAELDEEQKEKLDKQLQMLLAEMRKAPARMPEITVTYFQPDARKDGGSYLSLSGSIKRIDERRQILFTDGTALPMDNIISIEGDLFKDMG